MNTQRKIGKGRTAEVFLTAEGCALKLFYPEYPMQAVERELRNARMAVALHIPTPRCYGLVTVQDRAGILYERAAGESLLNRLMRTGDVAGCASTLARLHRQLLTQTLPEDALDVREFLRHEIERNGKLPVEEKSRTLAQLAALPGGNALCHGDFHPDNVLMDGERATVLDWMNLCRGDPISDVAQTWHLLARSPLPPDVPAAQEFEEMRGLLADEYIRRMGMEKERLAQWLPVIKAARFG